MSPREWLGNFGFKKLAGPGVAALGAADDIQNGMNPFIAAGRNIAGTISGGISATAATALTAEPGLSGLPVIANAWEQGNKVGKAGFDSAIQKLGMGNQSKPVYGSLDSSVNKNPEYYDPSVTLWESRKGSGSTPPPSLNPEVPQKGTQTGGSNLYAGMSEQEIKDAYDRLRYGDNFDKARDYMNKGQSDPFDSTYNPNKFLVNDSGQKKAVEEGLKMHEAFFGPGGGRSRQLSTPTSSSSASQTSARGSGMRNEGSATKEKPFGINFSGPLQNNTRGSDSFDKGKEPVRGLPTYTDHRKRQQSLRTVQKRLQQYPPVNSARPADTPSLDFQSVYNMAINSGAKFPELVAAQFQLESGGGTSELAQKHHNLFGQKGNGVNYKTLEDGSNGMYAIKDDFMVFDNPQESVNYLVDRWYKDYNQYKGVNNAPSAYQAAQMLANQGYATDRNYTNKLINILRQQGY